MEGHYVISVRNFDVMDDPASLAFQVERASSQALTFIPLPWRAILLIDLGILCWASNLHLLHLVGIDVAHILDVQSHIDLYPLRSLSPSPRVNTFPTSTRLHPAVYKLLASLSAWSFGSWLLFRILCGGNVQMIDQYKILPSLCIIGLLSALVCPFNVFQKRERDLFLHGIHRCLFSPMGQPIHFSDVLLADIFTSFAKVIGDLWISTCMLVPWGSLRVVPVAQGWLQWIVPSLMSLPYVIRLRQCLIEYLLSPQRHKPALLNAVKYATAFPVIFLSAAQRLVVSELVAEKGSQVARTPWHGEHRLFRLWLLAVVINSGYSFWWDVTNDWGLSLLHPSRTFDGRPIVSHRSMLLSPRNKFHSSTPTLPISQNNEANRPAPINSLPSPPLHRSLRPYFPRGLRPTRLFHDPAIYYIAIGLNLILRLTWSLKLSSHLHSVTDLEVGIFLMEALELIRRWMWVFFRVEWEVVRKGSRKSGGVRSPNTTEDELEQRPIQNNRAWFETPPSFPPKLVKYMFYSEAILSRRGPLAKVWLAAHWERKLSKTQTMQTDISQSVGAIMGQEVEVMALRLSGQLLLGVVRIYSRKAKYLLDDCNEALLKIKMAFRPGVVDMTEDQLAVNRNAITLQGGGLDLDLMLPDVNWDLDFDDFPAQPGGQHIARQADITLATTNDLQPDLDDPGYGFDLGPSDGIGSQDFELDLGLDFGEGPSNVPAPNEDDSMSVELRRDAPALRDPRDSIDPGILSHGDVDKDFDAFSARSREASEFGGGAMDFDFGGYDETLPEKAKSSHASSPLTELPPTPLPDATPRKLNESSPSKRASSKKKPKEKKQIIDSVIELEEGPGAKGRGRNRGLGSYIQKDVSEILADQRFLPASRTVMRLLEIRADPVAHFMPTKPGPSGGLLFNAGPPGLAPELTEMFMRPITNLMLSKRRGDAVDDRPGKKPRLDSVVGDVSEIEQLRRAGSVARSMGIASDVPQGGRGEIDFGGVDGMGIDDYHMDVEFQVDASGDQDKLGLSKAADETRVSTPAADFAEEVDTYADLDCPIATFDIRPSQSQSTGLGQMQDEQVDLDERDQKSGYSRNTAKALSIIRKGLDPATEPEGEKVLSFANMSEKATRRAAASFFFELLVLATRDCIKVSQTGHFENIEIRAKEKLWDHKLRQMRRASIAPSITSSLGL